MAQDQFRNPSYSAWEANDPNSSYGQIPSISNVLVPTTRTNNYVMPKSTYPSPSRTSYAVDNRSLHPSVPITSKSENSSTKNGCLESCQSHISVTRIVGFLAGAIITGIPLIILVTLFVQQSTSTTTTTTAASGNNGGSNAVTTGGLPAQCSSSVHTQMTDATRLVTNPAFSCCPSDCSLANGWYRISGAAGTRLATSPVSSSLCGASQPIWFNGTLPTTVGATTSGVGCANSGGNLCAPSLSSSVVLATNCGSYYVFYLTWTPSCSWNRYCTTF